MDEITKKLLNFDGIDEAEKKLGKSWDKFDDVERSVSIFNIIKNNDAKANHLKFVGDTYSRMTWEEFKNLIKENGFEPALEYDFQDGREQTNEFILCYNKDKGMIICATSYNNKQSVNDGTFYGQIQAKNENDADTIWNWISTGGVIDEDKLIFSTSHDVREGLFSKIDELEKASDFLPVWIKKEFLWFLDYTESKVDGYDYEEITQSKIDRCPEDFRKIIGM